MLKTVCSRICEQKMYERKSRNFYLAAARPNNARAARSMTETSLNRLSIADRCPLSLHKQRKSEHFLTAASCHKPTHAVQQNVLMMFQRRLACVDRIGNHRFLRRVHNSWQPDREGGPAARFAGAPATPKSALGPSWSTTPGTTRAPSSPRT